ncbi:phosphoribosylformimino-5-aminoimidazole carboxamide ribotide isomerase [bacterium]|nr:phosphoribosylformimino-5-aminoimidazole carboxamide ribotide isomerase [bacterium]
MLRPCIDLHEGRVKQIVGSTLRDGSPPVTNFQTDRSAAHYVRLYKADGLQGGHIIMLGAGNEQAAREALATWPGGMQIGGGINPENARDWLDAGASHVIVTSYVFQEGAIDWKRLEEMAELVGRQRLVLDLSCRFQNDCYYVVTDRWQTFTHLRINGENLLKLAEFADEFLVHAADVEGKQQGVDLELISLLAASSPIPTTYAGGVRSLDDMRQVWRVSRGRLELTIGSALDIFGGPIPYRQAVDFDRELRTA